VLGRRFAGCQIARDRVIQAAMTTNHARLLALLSAIAAAAVLRLIPHPPNFTPIGAMALFSGAYLGRRMLAFTAPLAALLLSDLVLGFYSHMEITYLAVALAVVIGWVALKRVSPLRLGAAALASSVLFFAITNFGVWLFSGMYAANLGGLSACFAAGVPFFQNSVGGDLFYTALLFGGFALAEHFAPRLRLREARAA
jgi:hypothetical protein